MSHRPIWQSDIEGSSLCTRNRSSCTHLQTFHLGKQVRFPLRLAQWQSWIMDSLPWISGSRFWIPIFFCGTWILDSNLFPWNLDSGFQSFSVEPGFWIPIFSGIPDSLCCIRIPKPRIQESMSIVFPDSRIRIPLHAVIRPMKGYSSEQGSRVAGASNQLSGGGSCPFWPGVFLCCCCYCFLFAIKPQSGLYEFRDALAQLLRSWHSQDML